MSAKKDRSSPPCCDCAKRNTRCDGTRECYRVWGRYWEEKAAVCTHPSWAKVKD